MKYPRLLICLTILIFLAVRFGFVTLKDHSRQSAARQSLVSFPLRGYFLVYERDELSWYRVSVPENTWTKIAAGSFMLENEFSVKAANATFLLSKIEGKQIHQVDVRTGKNTYVPLPVTPKVSKMFPLEDYDFAWQGHVWIVTHAGKHWTIPARDNRLLGPSEEATFGTVSYMQPFLVVSPHEMVFVKVSLPKDQDAKVEHDFVAVDSLTGSQRRVMHVPEGNMYFLQDPAPASKRTYFLNQDDTLECWTWSHHQFVRERSWQLPPTAAGEYYSSLITIIDKEWMIGQTFTSEVVVPLRPKYFAFNLHTSKWERVLDPLREHRGDIVAWIPRGGAKRPVGVSP